MSIIYTCRHCGHAIGSLEKQLFSASKLGLDILTETEMQYMMEQKANGDVHIKVICESCEDSLKRHPNYYELDNFIQ